MSVGAPSWLRTRFTASSGEPFVPTTDVLPGTDVAGLAWRKFSGATLIATLIDDADARTARAQPFQFLEKQRSESLLGTLGTSLAEVRREIREREMSLGELWAGASKETKLLAYTHLGTELAHAGQSLVLSKESVAPLQKLARGVDILGTDIAVMKARGREDAEHTRLYEAAIQKLEEQAPTLIESAQLDRLLLAAAEPFLIGKSEKRSLLDLKLEAATLEGSALLIAEAQRARKSGSLDMTAWTNLSTVAIAKLPHAASPGGRALLALAADEGVAIDPDVRKALHAALRNMGYYVTTEARLTAAEVERAIADNVTEPDLVFRDLLARAGSPPGPLTIGVMDGGFAPMHAAIRDSLHVNEDEVPDRSRDADGDGVRGNVYGHNLSGGYALDHVGWSGIETGLIAHGTHVAGIATSGTDRIRSFLVTRSSGRGDLEAAIEMSIAQGAKIINMSFSPWEAHSVAEIRRCIERHPEVLFIKAAGNEGGEVGVGGLAEATEVGAKIHDNLIVVAASEEDGKRQSTSNYSTRFVAVATRGPQYSATIPPFSDDAFVWTGKTSQAAPLVTNVASKMKLLNPSLDPPAIKRILMETSTRDAAWTDMVEAGGQIDPTRALRVAALLHLIKVKELAPDAAVVQLGIEPEAAHALLEVLRKLGV